MSRYASDAAASRGAPKPATPYHCPFCGDEDLRPAEEDPQAWTCRSCARVFTVGLFRVDQSLIPAHRPDEGPHEQAGPR
ncbi:MAG: hypothetical protein ABJA74_06785 [Lapillicoccus sp.]